MDLFDMTASSLQSLRIPSSDFQHVPREDYPRSAISHSNPSHMRDLASGLTPLSETPILILGVQSDILFPVEQQRELASALQMVGNKRVSYFELGGVWGHDTFLLVYFVYVPIAPN